MASLNSDQMTLSAAGSKIKSNEQGGKVRTLYFSFTVPAVPNIGDIVSLGVLPVGARVLGGQFQWSVVAGAAATIAIGYTGASGRYFTAAVTNALTIFRIADTALQFYGDELAASQTILATNAVAAWPVADVCKGHLLYVVD